MGRLRGHLARWDGREDSQSQLHHKQGAPEASCATLVPRDSVNSAADWNIPAEHGIHVQYFIMSFIDNELLTLAEQLDRRYDCSNGKPRGSIKRQKKLFTVT